MPAPKTSRETCPRCGRPARRLIRCSVCGDRVCVDQCTMDDESVACKNCVSLGVGDAAERADDGAE
jgi:hypothetical protein